MDERRVASSTIGLPRCESVKSQKSTQVPFVPLCRACIVGKGQRSSTTFSPWWCSVGLCNNADRVAENFVPTFERTTRTQLFRVTATPCPILTWLLLSRKDVRVHGAWVEFINKSPDHSNMTFEETDGGLDRSYDSLGAAFKTRQRGETHS